MLTEATFDTGEVSLHYALRSDDAAEGPPLLLLHGISQRWLAWGLVLESIGAGRRVFALDARGHGQSGRVPDGYRFGDYARDQQAFLREVVREPAVIVGSSLGAMNAIYLAAETPDLVRGLVLVDPPLYVAETGLRDFEATFQAFAELAASDLEPEAIAGRLAEHLPDIPAELRAVQAQFLALLDPRTLGQALDGTALEGWDTDALLARITCPTLLMVGEVPLGGAIAPDEAERADKLLATGRTLHLKGVGHLPHLETPDVFANTVRDFLADL